MAPGFRKPQQCPSGERRDIAVIAQKFTPPLPVRNPFSRLFRGVNQLFPENRWVLKTEQDGSSGDNPEITLKLVRFTKHAATDLVQVRCKGGGRKRNRFRPKRRSGQFHQFVAIQQTAPPQGRDWIFRIICHPVETEIRLKPFQTGGNALCGFGLILSLIHI